MENEEKEVNCWIVYLMPFIQKERDEDFVEEYQLYCIENRIFGMGWSNCKNGELKREFFGKNLKDAGVLEEFKKRYKELNKSDSYISEKALKSFKDIWPSICPVILRALLG